MIIKLKIPQPLLYAKKEACNFGRGQVLIILRFLFISRNSRGTGQYQKVLACADLLSRW